MFKHSVKALSVGAAIVLATTGAWAQTPGTATTPATVGVTPQDAREATQKAVPRSDTGTLVRTEPSAADRASNAANDAKNAVTPNARGNMNTGNANPSEPRNSGTTTGTVNNTTTPSQAMGITGTVPGAEATSGDATNTRNNPGTATGTTGRSMDTPMDNNNMTNRSNMNNKNSGVNNNNNARRNNRPARADRN